MFKSRIVPAGGVRDASLHGAAGSGTADTEFFARLLHACAAKTRASKATCSTRTATCSCSTSMTSMAPRWAANGSCRSASTSRRAPASRSPAAPCPACTRLRGRRRQRDRAGPAAAHRADRVHRPRAPARAVVGCAALLRRRTRHLQLALQRVGRVRRFRRRSRLSSSGSSSWRPGARPVRWCSAASASPATRFSAGVEVRYQSADAELGPEFAVIADEPRIDLGGWTYQFTVGWRFGR